MSLNFETPEAEYMLFDWGGTSCVTLGNDQCDIEVEAKLSGEKSNNLCQKTVAGTAWTMAEVLPHWDAARTDALPQRPTATASAPAPSPQCPGLRNMGDGGGIGICGLS